MPNKISFKDINDDYSWARYRDFKVIIMKKNGYINATKICHGAETRNGRKKEFANWKENANANAVMEEIVGIIGIPKKKLLIPITGGRITVIRGTYVHPMLMTHIAYWVSPKFAVKVSLWVEEWKKYSDSNLIDYYVALSELEPYHYDDKEKSIQTKLHHKYGGEIEVKTKAGKIDLLTNERLIEIKTYKDWKCALGQLIAYSMFYPDRQKCMYLFNVGDNNIKTIQKLCDSEDIELMIHD